MNKYVRIPVKEESRDKLKSIVQAMKLEYDKFIGYDEVIEELVRNIEENNESIKKRVISIQRNKLRLQYRNAIINGK